MTVRGSEELRDHASELLVAEDVVAEVVAVLLADTLLAAEALFVVVHVADAAAFADDPTDVAARLPDVHRIPSAAADSEVAVHSAADHFHNRPSTEWGRDSEKSPYDIIS